MKIPILITAALILAGCERNDPVMDEGAELTTTDEGGDAGGLARTKTESVDPEPAPPAAQFVQRAAISDMYEIAAGKLASEKGESAAVRKFGTMMVAAHGEQTAVLKQAVAASGRQFDFPAALDAQHQAQIDVLKRLDGADFDREYANQQLAAHRNALALLKGYARDGDTPDLRQFAQAAIPKVQRHHDRIFNDINAPLPVSAEQQTYDKPALSN